LQARCRVLYVLLVLGAGFRSLSAACEIPISKPTIDDAAFVQLLSISQNHRHRRSSYHFELEYSLRRSICNVRLLKAADSENYVHHRPSRDTFIDLTPACFRPRSLADAAEAVLEGEDSSPKLRECRVSREDTRQTPSGMSIQVLLKDHPHRTLALTTDNYALVFRHTHSADQGYSSSSTSLTVQSSNRHVGQTLSPRCKVEFAPYASLDFTGYRTIGGAQGTLGLITLNNDVFLCTVTTASQVATPRPGETVQKIQLVDFCKTPCCMTATSAKRISRLSQPIRL
jgi:hypothetical protein